MRSNRPYVQIDPDVLERARQIDLLSYLREFEPSNLVKVKGTSNVYCTAEHDSLKISNGKWYWWLYILTRKNRLHGRSEPL